MPTMNHTTTTALPARAKSSRDQWFLGGFVVLYALTYWLSRALSRLGGVE